jgi:glycosyltransferase involved in cell wall biosynthesis
VRVGRPHLGVVGPYPPHRSGLAGHNGELVRALRRELDVVVCAIDRYGLPYPDEVVAVIRQDQIGDYRRGARVLSEHRVDAVLIHSSDGGFGGPAGSHVLDLAHELRLRGIPYLVHLHTLRRPADPAWLRATAALTQSAALVLVTTQEARTWLVSRHLVDPGRLRVVRVGAPVAASPGAPPPSPVRPTLADALAGAGRVVSTVGSIRPGKGLDSALLAVAKVAAAVPDVRYVIAGAGNGYVDQLREQVTRLGLGFVVRILDTYLSPAEMAAVIDRTDVYLAPAIPLERTWSAGLTCALAAGRAIVTAEHPYAAELLASRVGSPAGVVVAPTADTLAEAVLSLLDDPAKADAVRAQARQVGRQVNAARVARRLAALVREVTRPASLPAGAVLDGIDDWLSTGSSGADFTAGFDGADSLDARRAVVAAAVLSRPAVKHPGTVPVTAWSVAVEAAQRSIRRLATLPADSDETFAGLAIWAAGRVGAGSAVPEPVRAEARAVRESWLNRLPRAPLPAAYACLGLADVRRTLTPVLARAAARVDAAVLRAGRGSAWPWYTARLEGEGVRVSQAQIAAGLRLRDPSMVRRGLVALDWYAGRVGLGPADGLVRLPSTTPGFPGVELATDAGALVEALVQAHLATGSSYYARLALRAWQWFHGANRHAEPVFDADTGWCRLGLRRQAQDRTADGLPLHTSTVDGPSVPATLAFAGAALALAGAELVAPPPLPALATAA